MCDVQCIVFGSLNLTRIDVEGKRIIDIGSYDFNGSLRPIVEFLNPLEYVGIDIQEGPGVDMVCSAEDVLKYFGPESFDIVISTEMIEHVKDWKTVLSNFKNICKVGGIIIITTRSYGYPYHPHPDFWRFQKEDMENIFSDCEIVAMETDKEFPGVLIKVIKPFNFVENDLTDYKLYNIITDKRVAEINENDFKKWHFIKISSKEKLKSLLFKIAHSLKI